MSTVQAQTLQVYNLDEKVTEDHLYELFLQAGPLECVRLIKSRGTASAFIVFKHECSVEYAKNIFEGTKLFQQELIFNESVFRVLESQQAQSRRPSFSHQQQQQQQHQNQRFQGQQRHGFQHNQSLGTRGSHTSGQQNYFHHRSF